MQRSEPFHGGAHRETGKHGNSAAVCAREFEPLMGEAELVTPLPQPWSGVSSVLVVRRMAAFGELG